MNLIKSFQEITINWIEDILHIDKGTVLSFNISKSGETPVSQIALISIDYNQKEKSNPSSLFVKITKENLQKELRGVGKREVMFYNKILPMLDHKYFPHCYYVGFSNEENIFNLVLEDLSKTHFHAEWPLPPSMKYCRKDLELELLKTYHDELSKCGVQGYTLNDLILDYKRSVIGQIATPIMQWEWKLWVGIWYYNYERIFLAYDDLNCADLLD